MKTGEKEMLDIVLPVQENKWRTYEEVPAWSNVTCYYHAGRDGRAEMDSVVEGNRYWAVEKSD